MEKEFNKSEAGGAEFVRDKVAWFCYLMIASYCYATAALGPLMSFLRSELHFNYTVASYHFSIWAFGVVIAGFIGDKIMQRFGRPQTAWTCCLGLSAGISIIILGKTPLATIFGAFICGINGSIVSQTCCAIMADRFYALRAIVITEANIAASLFCSISPLAVGKLSQTALGWRSAFFLPVIFFALIFLCFVKSVGAELKTEQKAKVTESGALPGRYWLCWTLIFFSVACEWSVIYWSADFMEKIAGLAKSDAAACVTSFLTAMVTGRILGSRLAREVASLTLLRLASFLALGGFLFFWLNRAPIFCVLGLFITGLGISNVYPLTLSMAIGSAAGLTSKAASRMALSSGGATLIAPLLLGQIAERYGIFNALGTIAFILFFCGILIFLPLWNPKEK